MYDRKFWEEFTELFGNHFNKESAKKPLIYFDGYQEDNIDPNVYNSLTIGLMPKSDCVNFLISHSDSEEVETKRWILVLFENIVEVQVIVIRDEEDKK